MASIFKTISSYLTPDIVAKAAQTLGEEESNTKKAMEILIPSLLGKLVDEKDNDALLSNLVKAGENNVIDQLDNIFEGHGIINKINFGERIENALLGSDNKEFPKTVAESSGISEKNADRLSNWVSAMIGGHIGKLLEEGEYFATIISKIKTDLHKSEIDTSNNLASMLDVDPFLDADDDQSSKSICGSGKGGKCGERRSRCWIWWLLLAILIILLLLWWRSCDDKKQVTLTESEIELVDEGIEICEII